MRFAGASHAFFAVAAMGSSLAWAQATLPHRVGILVPATPAGYATQLEAFRAGLRDLGYVEGRSVVLDVRYAHNDLARLPSLADGLVRAKPDLIVTSGPGIAPTRKATGTIPIVMAATGDAVRSGFAESFARPGGNLTGSSFFFAEINVKRLEVLREAAPSLRRVAVLLGASSASAADITDAMRAAAASLGLEVRFHDARTHADVDAALRDVVREGAEALVVTDTTIFVAEATRICGRATDARILVIGFAECARGGGALAYGVDFPALWRRAAYYVDRVLKGGMPATMPIERAARFELLANPAAARRAGVELPRSLIGRADEVLP